MKVVSLFVSALVGAAAPACGYLGQVVQSFPPPGGGPDALAISGNCLYVLCGTPRHIYRVDPANGSVISSYPSPFGFPTRGLGYEYGGYLWIGTYSEPYSRIVKCDEATGSIYSSFRLIGRAMFGGIACQGIQTQPDPLKAIISNGFAPEPVTRHTTGGSLLSTFHYPEWATYFDPGWDYGNGLIWWGNRTPYYAHVYGFTTDGSLVASFPAPAGNPYGCTYLDGYLWISTGGPPTYIWKLHCPKDFEKVAPASLGWVKALFR